jgi:hypothetical protein
VKFETVFRIRIHARYADPDPAFSANADPDQASKINANPNPDPSKMLLHFSKII